MTAMQGEETRAAYPSVSRRERRSRAVAGGVMKAHKKAEPGAVARRNLLKAEA